MEDRLLKDVHRHSGSCFCLPKQTVQAEFICGTYSYYHYGCDGFDDRGWGCGYRTLQTLCSWIQNKEFEREIEASSPPSLPEIQEALVSMGDKPKKFIGSKDWIGSFEACICIDYFYNVPCKVEHIRNGGELKNVIPMLKQHFKIIGSPVMMGGESDTSSKCILGVAEGILTSLLILDPHFYGQSTKDIIQAEGWVKWRPLDSFVESSFYNLCLPQYKIK
ncbi:ufm1-specific protease 1-like [Anneissia japonica]|uniref:ufm1-specific protease 1-like n=1 Tax=Anneissia japonica TaxID=1529436 RepID=UPI0014255B8D|nr:ufm1-specific protease 1-like [Anneissia japonica]